VHYEHTHEDEWQAEEEFVDEMGPDSYHAQHYEAQGQEEGHAEAGKGSATKATRAQGEAEDIKSDRRDPHRYVLLFSSHVLFEFVNATAWRVLSVVHGAEGVSTTLSKPSSVLT
jgi:hypothetical protein